MGALWQRTRAQAAWEAIGATMTDDTTRRLAEVLDARIGEDSGYARYGSARDASRTAGGGMDGASGWATMPMGGGPLYATGDTHGDGIDLLSRVTACPPGSTIAVCGDAGIRYGDWVSMTMLAACDERSDCAFVVMRGNHDTRYWRDATLPDGTPRDGWALTEPDRHGSSYLYETAHPNVLYVRDDGGLYDVGGTDVLFIPGAYSADQAWRMLTGNPYEREEQLTEYEMRRLGDIAASTRGRLVVMSHTCPRAWEGTVSRLFSPYIDQSGVDKAMETWMDGIWETVRGRCDGWYFGHYHADMGIGGTGGKARMLYHDVVRVDGGRRALP